MAKKIIKSRSKLRSILKKFAKLRRAKEDPYRDQRRSFRVYLELLIWDAIRWIWRIRSNLNRFNYFEIINRGTRR